MRRDHFGRWCLRLPGHPAVTGLDEQQHVRLQESLRHREPGEELGGD